MISRRRLGYFPRGERRLCTSHWGLGFMIRTMDAISFVYLYCKRVNEVAPPTVLGTEEWRALRPVR
jgi:hypothetical protein